MRIVGSMFSVTFLFQDVGCPKCDLSKVKKKSNILNLEKMAWLAENCYFTFRVISFIIYIVETDVNRCTRDSCDPSAICINVALGKQCICPNGRRKQRVNNVIKCVEEPRPSDPCTGYCKNGGICQMTEKGLTKCK